MSDFDDYVVEMQNRDREERAELSELREIVRQVAEHPPVMYVGDGGDPLCFFCENDLKGRWDRPSDTFIYDAASEHEPDCLWLRARKLAQRGTH
jgi:hypothetical protein